MSGPVTDVWARIAAPLPPGSISWRQDGKVMNHNGKPFARFVPYVEANTVRERLDEVVPGDWDLTLELLPAFGTIDDGDDAVAFKARLNILGVLREDVGQGKDYKQASTDAFKRAAVRFGFANELYSYEQNWVPMDGDGKYAKPTEDPQAVYVRRYGKKTPAPATPPAPPGPGRGDNIPAQIDPLAPPVPKSTLTDTESVTCPKCGGQMYDRRKDKKNPKAPDYACRMRNCNGVIWPEKSAPGIADTSYMDRDRETSQTDGVPTRKPVSGGSYEDPGEQSHGHRAATEDELPF